MATLQDKIEGYVGTFADTDSLTSWLVQSVHRLVDALSDKKLEHYATEVNDNGTGVSVAGKRILRGHKDGYGAQWIDPMHRARVIDSNSIFKGTSTQPKMYIEGGKVYIKPSGGSVISFDYPALTYTTVAGSTQFLIDYEDYIVLYVAIRCVEQNISTKISTITNLSFSTESGITYDFSTQIAQIQTYIDDEHDFELATAKINEVNLRLADIKTQMDEMQILISQEDKRLMDTIQKGMQEITSSVGLLKELNYQYESLMKNLS